jgi:hypothetical protein
MSINRWAKKQDSSQAAIVADLRRAHVVVEIIGKPVDLMVRLRSWPVNRWALIEVKSATSEGKIPSIDKRQKAQNQFCADYHVPKFTNAAQILEYLK